MGLEMASVMALASTLAMVLAILLETQLARALGIQSVTVSGTVSVIPLAST
jgi:hypothetical protein